MRYQPTAQQMSLYLIWVRTCVFMQGARYFCAILSTSAFARQIYKKVPNIKRHKISLSSGCRHMRTDMAKLTGTFRQYANAPNNMTAANKKPRHRTRPSASSILPTPILTFPFRTTEIWLKPQGSPGENICTRSGTGGGLSPST
jgi:hypothetical protein